MSVNRDRGNPRKKELYVCVRCVVAWHGGKLFAVTWAGCLSFVRYTPLHSTPLRSIRHQPGHLKPSPRWRLLLRSRRRRRRRLTFWSSWLCGCYCDAVVIITVVNLALAALLGNAWALPAHLQCHLRFDFWFLAHQSRLV